MHRELLRGVPDPVVGSRLPEVIPCGPTGGALDLDEVEEGGGGAVDDPRVERPGEHDGPGPVGQRPDEFGLEGAPVLDAGHRRGGVDEYVVAHALGVGVVAGVGAGLDLRPEVVESEIRLPEPRSRGGVERGCHAA